MLTLLPKEATIGIYMHLLVSLSNIWWDPSHAANVVISTTLPSQLRRLVIFLFPNFLFLHLFCFLVAFLFCFLYFPPLLVICILFTSLEVISRRMVMLFMAKDRPVLTMFKSLKLQVRSDWSLFFTSKISHCCELMKGKKQQTTRNPTVAAFFSPSMSRTILVKKTLCLLHNITESYYNLCSTKRHSQWYFFYYDIKYLILIHLYYIPSQVKQKTSLVSSVTHAVYIEALNRLTGAHDGIKYEHLRVLCGTCKKP